MDKELVEFLASQTEVLKGISEKLERPDVVEKAAASSQTGFLIYGQNGIFGVEGVDRDVISAHMTVEGISRVLPMRPTQYEDPRFGIITGVSDTTGDEPDNDCDDAPVAYLKGGLLTARFGTVRRDTNTIDVQETIKRKNRGEFTDLNMMGDLLGNTNLAPASMSSADLLKVVTKAEMVVAAVAAERKLVVDMFQGTVAGGTFPGLDVQIATGQIDAETSTAMPAADSVILDFDNDLVDGTGRDIVEYVSSAIYEVENRARKMTLDPVRHILVISPTFWKELTAVWPCKYLTNKCTTGSSSTSNIAAVINDTTNMDMRTEMRNGMFLEVNGKKYPVILDDGIYEYDSTNSTLPAGRYASTLYVVPMVVRGTMPVTYREYLDYRAFAPEVALLNGMNDFWTDAGVYSWAIDNNKWCYKLALRSRQRIILRTPHLAAKIQNIAYEPLRHLRDPLPESSYWDDGGVSIRSDSLGAAVWS